MPEEEIRNIIELTIKKSIEEYKKSGLLKDSGDIAYSEISQILTNYYTHEPKDTSVAYAIQSQRFDPYYKIIPMYFYDRKAITTIAEELDVDVSTVVRNKKRLCLAIYNELGGYTK